MSQQSTQSRRSNSASFTTVEKLHPGMKVINGPFAIQSCYEVVANAEKTSAARHFLQQKAKDKGAKLVVVGRFAYVLTRSEFISTVNPSDKFRDKDGIKVKRRAKPTKTHLRNNAA